MQFGMLSRNGRGSRRAAESWAEDLWDIVVADRLGFQEVWISEHPFNRTADNLPSADLFICKAAALTKGIRFGPGIRPIPYYHPVRVATEATTVDHLTGGRYMAGFGGASTGGYFRQLGIDRELADKRAMMHEAIDLILRCWAEDEPFDFDGEFWHGRDICVQPKPFQQPRMPVGIASSGTKSTAVLAGEKGFLPIHSAFEGPDHMRGLDEIFDETCVAARGHKSRKDVRILRVVHVADTVRGAKEEVRAYLEPMVEESKTIRGGAPGHLKSQLPPGMELEDVDFDWLVDSGLFLVGDPEAVYQKARSLYDRLGGFGVLLFNVGTGSGNVPRRIRQRSWKLFMEYVAPRLASLDPDA